MGNCNSCGGSCGNCGGCAGSLVLTEQELDMLQLLAQIPFLPVARKASDMIPVYPGGTQDTATVLQCLEKKGLIDIDYRLPLSGFDYSNCSGYPVHGSMALTQRGQQVLEMLDIQGFTPEE